MSEIDPERWQSALVANAKRKPGAPVIPIAKCRSAQEKLNAWVGATLTPTTGKPGEIEP